MYETPWASQVVLEVKNPPANTGDLSEGCLGQEDPLEKGMQLTPGFLAWSQLPC